MHQAVDATLTHAQASAKPTDEQQTAIVNFELGLFTAQTRDRLAGELDAHGATGGPLNLSQQPFYPGINDSLGGDRAPFNPVAFSLFAPWLNLDSDREREGDDDDRAAARRAIAAGEVIFNTRALTITNVRGLNDNAALGKPQSITGTCTTCHDTPNVGNHSFPLPLDIGTSHDPATENHAEIAAGLAQLDVPDVPVYRIDGCPDPFTGQPTTIYTSDPGKALIPKLDPITNQMVAACADVNRIKGPILRALAARAPYFHNGAGANLSQVVDFYNQRFQMNLTEEEKEQLIAFLNSL
ncbi:MAG: hypothetical protein WBC04_15430 [Candidatus Acidiferrales bacterium]